MEALVLFTKLLIAPAVPNGYQYEQSRQKILQNRTTLTTADCRDYGMLQKKNEQEDYLIISRCQEEWFIFYADRASEPLAEYAAQQNTQYAPLRTGEGLWFLRIADSERLLYLSGKGITEIPDFRQLQGGWILQTGGAWFFVSGTNQGNAELIRLSPLFHDREYNSEYWKLISGGGYLNNEKLLALVFYINHERHFSLYDAAAGTWHLKPPELLLPGEREALEKGQNVIFRLATPPGNTRLYYDIYNGSEKIGRSAFHTEGESAIFTCKLPPGRHLIRLDRFSAKAGKGETSFVREKNILQLEPISVNIPGDRAVLIYIRPGKKHENKPLVLDYSYLPLVP